MAGVECRIPSGVATGRANAGNFPKRALAMNCVGNRKITARAGPWDSPGYSFRPGIRWSLDERIERPGQEVVGRHSLFAGNRMYHCGKQQASVPDAGNSVVSTLSPEEPPGNRKPDVLHRHSPARPDPGPSRNLRQSRSHAVTAARFTLSSAAREVRSENPPPPARPSRPYRRVCREPSRVRSRSRRRPNIPSCFPA